jgi:maltose phosphorylase
MAGTWMSIVEGFGGMRIKDDTLFFPKNSKRMEGYSFKINFRNQILTVAINHKETIFSMMGRNRIVETVSQYWLTRNI